MQSKGEAAPKEVVSGIITDAIFLFLSTLGEDDYKQLGLICMPIFVTQ